MFVPDSPSAISVAAHLYYLAKEKGVNNLSLLKLMKLLYIAHGCKLAVENSPLFIDEVQAWKKGPVISSVYHALKEKQCFPDLDIELDDNDKEYFLEENNKVLEFVIEKWGGFSGKELSDLTHKKDTPWDIAWNQKGGKNTFSFVIDNKDITNYYTEFFHS